MIQENKELLIKDISARLPYKVYIRIRQPFGCVYREEDILLTPDIIKQFIVDDDVYIFPFLRPMSSMTEEEKEKMVKLHIDDRLSGQIEICDANCIDFYNSHHLDYRGLIPKGLALEAPKEMYV